MKTEKVDQGIVQCFILLGLSAFDPGPYQILTNMMIKVARLLHIQPRTPLAASLSRALNPATYFPLYVSLFSSLIK